VQRLPRKPTFGPRFSYKPEGQIAAENLHPKGLKSGFVHLFVSTLHFPHEQHIKLYQARNSEQWSASAPLGISSESLHPISSFMVGLGPVTEVDSGNAGGDLITKTALDFWRAGRKREDIQLKDLEPVLSVGVFNNKHSGLWHSGLIDRNLIDYFIPFLPLEYSHVKMCVRAEMKARGSAIDEDVVTRVAEEMTFFPKDEKIYSDKGCKTVQSRLDFH
ncbi:hypothetical protein E2I00_004283, partial [Balaenoptera physalus]